MATGKIYFIYSYSSRPPTPPPPPPPPPSSSSSSSSFLQLLNSPVSATPVSLTHHFPTTTTTTLFTTRFRFRFPAYLTGRSKRGDLSARIAMLHQNPVVSDLLASALSGIIALSLLRLWQETAKRRLFDQKLNRKLVHISIGLVFMLCWPLFSSGHQGAVLAAITPGVNIIRMLLVGYGIWKDEATVKAMSRYGDHRELLKGPLYYALTITVACAVYWRTSPVGIAAICNLCAGDGMADVVGRRFGTKKLPYNRDKSFAGSVAFALAGFLASIAFMHYFASFGYMQKSREIVLGFLVVSLASAFVESLPISTELDDNLTVTLSSIFLGTFVF